MEPVTLGLLAAGAGIGTVLVLRARKNNAASSAAAPVISPNATPQQVAANQAALAANIQAGLANGTVRLGTNGVPFATVSPFDPSKTPAQLLNPDGTLGIIVTDFVTVSNDLLAASLVQGAGGLPGFAPGENVLMQVKRIDDPRVGPIFADTTDPKVQPPVTGISITPAMITGVQPAGSAASSAALVKN